MHAFMGNMVIRRRVCFAVVLTALVLVWSPPATVLIVLSVLGLPLALLEVLGARRAAAVRGLLRRPVAA